MFLDLKKKLTDNFTKLSKTGPLFYISIDRDEVWEKYLGAFDESVRQAENCNCCKSFLRQFSGIVSIQDNKVVSIWDDIDVEDYNVAVKSIRKYILSRPITDIFMSEFATCGTNKNLDIKRNILWEHFYLELPSKYLVRKGEADTIRGEKRDNKSVLERSLDELTLEATETTLELIAQNSLYRGKESEKLLQEFSRVQRTYATVPAGLKDNFCWLESTKVSQALTRIRNTAIGTLLQNLSAGMEMDAAVAKFEQVVAPANYKRPTALVTPRMIQDAKDKLQELGLLESLERRYATEADLNLEDILFTDKTTSVTDIFDELAKGTLVNPRTLSKVEEVTMEDFIKNILPTSKSIEVLLENNHLSKMVSLITAKDKTTPSLFKWANPFSWSYTGGITDSMKERVKAAGGKVDGVLRFSIQWNEDGKSICDLDAHAYEPGGQHIYYSSFKGYKTPMSGMLDVDMICPRKVGVENITWSDISQMKEGKYRFQIVNFDLGRNDGFTAQIEFNGEIHEFGSNQHLKDKIDIAEVTYSKKEGFSIKSLMDSKVNISSNEKWGLKTNQFVKVRKIMLSPNYWGGEVGNKHYMFFLDGCVSDEAPRPFFNEFLKQELDVHRKVFEILGSKFQVEPSVNQLSGIGFSETQNSHVIVNVVGKFKRTIKIKI